MVMNPVTGVDSRGKCINDLKRYLTAEICPTCGWNLERKRVRKVEFRRNKTTFGRDRLLFADRPVVCLHLFTI